MITTKKSFTSENDEYLDVVEYAENSYQIEVEDREGSKVRINVSKEELDEIATMFGEF